MNDSAPPAAPAASAPRAVIVVQNDVPVLDTGLFEQMQRVARILAASPLVPAHLNRHTGSGNNTTQLSPEEAFANCFLVVNQSVRWRMDPFAVAQGVFVTKGKIGYEGKLIGAVINTHPQLTKRLSYTYEGDGVNRKVTVSGRVKGDNEDRVVEGTVAKWKTDNDAWNRSPDQMLSYRGAREWARRWMPEAIYGVYADEEIQQEHELNPRPEAGSRSPLDTLRSTVVDAQQPEVVGQQQAAEPADAATDASTTTTRGTGQRTRGTPRQFKGFMERMAACTDADTLGVIYEDTKLTDWSPGEAGELLGRYTSRRQELQG